MQIQVNTDDNVEGRKELTGRIEAEAGATLARFSDQVTRVEVHLGDENAARSWWRSPSPTLTGSRTGCACGSAGPRPTRKAGAW